ncbi:hypothetical protein CF54_35725 [Streptomyces sp. Tu 6176]|uniref:hypothetical protein n=1 Tax=Streptomyces sp. Tu 6176 TaxID=1470557 RepID=UPI000452BBF1|nr:hypothetical protein CF54_35725 [Streptomyces sp. Tu 6176]
MRDACRVLARWDRTVRTGSRGTLDTPLGEHQFVVRDGERVPVPGGTEALGVWNKAESAWYPAHGGHAAVLGA